MENMTQTDTDRLINQIAADNGISPLIPEDPANLPGSGFDTAPAAPFVITDESGANWFLAKLAAIDSEHERVAVQAARRRAELQADRERLLHLYGEQLTAWARTEAETRRRKTVTLLQGSVSFRSVPARFMVTDETQAIEAARAACPAALAVATITRLDRNALLDYVKETGEVLPGVELIAASESVSIKPGAKE